VQNVLKVVEKRAGDLMQLAGILAQVVTVANDELAAGAVVSVTSARIRLRSLPIGRLSFEADHCQKNSPRDVSRSSISAIDISWAEANVLRCGDTGLRGTLAIEGVGKRYSAAMVKVYWQDGATRVYTITAAGRRRLEAEHAQWEQFALSMRRVLRAE
jgi:hypothetical protein